MVLLGFANPFTTTRIGDLLQMLPYAFTIIVLGDLFERGGKKEAVRGGFRLALYQGRTGVIITSKVARKSNG
jgi:hypothetical protein